MDVRIIANIGFLKGYAGDAVIYAAKTPGGTYLAAVQHLEVVEGDDVPTWKYYRKSMIENASAANNVALSGSFNLALLTDQAQPDFVAEGDETIFKTITTVVNGADLPRLYDLQNAYTLKGEGVTTSEVEALKLAGPFPSGSGSNVPGGTNTGSIGESGKLIPTAAELADVFKNPGKFIQDFPFFVAGVIGIIYWFRRKKKKPLWIF